MKIVYGVTGSIGCGKTYTCSQLVKIGKIIGLDVNHINTDLIGREIIGKDPKYQFIRDKFVEEFGREIRDNDGSIKKEVLSRYLTQSKDTLDKCNKILLPYSLAIVNEKIRSDKSNLTLVESALFAEHNFYDLVEHNMMLVTASKEVQEKRIEDRKCPYKGQLRRREMQLSQNQKLESIVSAISNKGFGKLVIFDTSEDPKDNDYYKLLQRIV